LDEVLQVLQQSPDIELGQQHFVDVLEIMPYLITQWRQRVDRELMKVVKGERMVKEGASSDQSGEGDLPMQTDADAEALLNLATTVFKCQICTTPFGFTSIFGDGLDCSPTQEPLYYPRVISHKCNTRVDLMSVLRDDTSTSFYQGDPSRVLGDLTSFRKAWSSEHLHVDMKAMPVVERVVLASGLDPKVTSADEMDAIDRKLGCLECLEWTCDFVDIQMFGWRDAVRRFFTRVVLLMCIVRLIGQARNS
jgi:hypothetical protein